MKHLRLSILGSMLTIAMLAWSGCGKDPLDLKPHGPTEQNYFSQESEFTKAIFGVYSKLSDFYWYHGSPYAGLYTIFYLPGDDITCNDQEEFEQFGPLSPASGRVAEFYGVCYQLIARANVVIDKIEAVPDGIYVTPGLKDFHKGEALFLRAFANYYLWNYFGTAPLDTARVTSSEQFFPVSSTGTQLLDEAIADFSAAADLLPDSWDAANKGRVTKNSANGFLGKSLVFRASATKTTADYQSALTAFQKISGASLVPNFEDNFSWENENNSESLFEYQATQAFGGDNIWLSNDFDNAIGDMLAYYGFYDNDGGTYAGYSKSRFYATNKFKNAFEAGDPRVASTLVDSNRFMLKYVTDQKFGQNGGGSANNTRLLRYADVLLLEAEATLQSGGSTSDAIAFINQVRARARGAGSVPADFSTGDTDKDKIMKWIMDERLRELGGEGQRWLDIRRWALQGLLTLDNAFFDSNSSTMSFQSPKHLVFPIPNSERDVNPNVGQNTGY